MERWKKRSRRGERRILTVIAVITVLIAVGLIAFYVWGPRILRDHGITVPAVTLENGIEPVPETDGESAFLSDDGQLTPEDMPEMAEDEDQAVDFSM